MPDPKTTPDDTKTKAKTDTALAKLDRRMRSTTFLVTVEHDGDEEGVILALSAFGNAVKHEPSTQAKTGGRTHDFYGNPYEDGAKTDVSRDAYGNPYNTPGSAPVAAAPEPPRGRDSYGNPY